jgi:hypothetical protein
MCFVCVVAGLLMSTAIQADNKSEPVTNAGLRSDGELVQGKTANNRFKPNTPPARQQQGRVLTDSDHNEGETQGHTIHLQNATVSSIKAPSLNNKKTEKKSPQK